MPNWCVTNITIKTPNAENLVENIKKWTTKDFYKNDFGNKWLGNVIAGSNIAEYDGKNFYTPEKKQISCKGWIDYFFIGGNSFFIGKDVTNEVHISTETAWGPYLQMWLKIIDKYYPEAKLTYCAEEINMGVYNISGKTSKLKLRGCNAYQPDLSRALFCEICSIKDNMELLFLKITFKGVSYYGKYI